MPLFPYQELTLDSPLPISEVSQRLMNLADPSVMGSYSLLFPNQVLNGEITDEGFDLISKVGYRSANTAPAIHGDWVARDGKTRIRLQISAQKGGIYWTKFFFFLTCVLLLVCVALQIRDYIHDGKNNGYFVLCFPWTILAGLTYVQIWGRFKEEGRRVKTNLASLWEAINSTHIP
jgi:hypothetical protein